MWSSSINRVKSDQVDEIEFKHQLEASYVKLKVSNRDDSLYNSSDKDIGKSM